MISQKTVDSMHYLLHFVSSGRDSQNLAKTDLYIAPGSPMANIKDFPVVFMLCEGCNMPRSYYYDFVCEKCLDAEEESRQVQQDYEDLWSSTAPHNR